jgi:hypothetical protein
MFPGARFRAELTRHLGLEVASRSPSPGDDAIFATRQYHQWVIGLGVHVCRDQAVDRNRAGVPNVDDVVKAVSARARLAANHHAIGHPNDPSAELPCSCESQQERCNRDGTPINHYSEPAFLASTLHSSTHELSRIRASSNGHLRAKQRSSQRVAGQRAPGRGRLPHLFTPRLCSGVPENLLPNKTWWAPTWHGCCSQAPA